MFFFVSLDEKLKNNLKNGILLVNFEGKIEQKKLIFFLDRRKLRKK
jgi:hypothetical protein